MAVEKCFTLVVPLKHASETVDKTLVMFSLVYFMTSYTDENYKGNPAIDH